MIQRAIATVRHRKKLVTVAAVLILTPCGIFAWLAWQGWLFPVPYVETTAGGNIAKGHHIRVDWYTWSNEGRWTLCAANGRKIEEGSYRNGRQVGTWTTWNADGTLCEITEYDGDGLRLLGVTEYENGAVKRDRKFVHDGNDKSRDRVGTFTTENGVTKFKKDVPNSGTIWSRNPDKNAEIEEAYKDEVRAGATDEEAKKAIDKKFADEIFFP